MVWDGVEGSCREWCGMGGRDHVENGVGWGGGIM